MRSYYSHLQAVQSVGEEISVNYKPTFRSSAIFPVIHSSKYSSKVIFMGYWLLKRHIREIGLLYTLRNAKGLIVSRKYILINTTKAFSISLNEFADSIGDEFTGSLELEIFSTQDLVYPYPAFVLVYYSDQFSTAVHTTGRIYNDTEDLIKNEQYAVRESGFDIYDDPNLSPFVAITNGALENTAVKFDYEINNTSGEAFKGSFQLPAIKPYETIFMELRKYIDLSSALKHGAGSIKLGHTFSGFFPRFVVGNFDNRSQSISITHSYYDSSALKDDQSFWNRKDLAMNDSSVSIPLYLTDGYYTRLAIYPIFSPSDFTLSFSFYTKDGALLKTADTVHQIKSAENKYEQIDFGDIVKKENIDLQAVASVNLVCNWNDKSKIPTRIKFGLNVGKTSDDVGLPSNICFAPQVGNPHVLTKKGTFRWAPFINIGKSEVVFTNSGSLKNYTTPATVKVAFHREDDDTIISRELIIPANGYKKIDLSTDQELTAFFNNKSGWVTAQSDNPFLNGYYFDFFDNGAVCADHIF
jgi:hypothetical protein